MPLTDPACKNAKCPDGKRHHRIYDTGGLYLEVLPTGAKHWRWKYRFPGQDEHGGPKLVEKRLALGSYPAISLKQARLDRDAARQVLAGGIDPVQARKDERAARAPAAQPAVDPTYSFEAIARQWHARWAPGRSERHAGYVMRRLEADVFPAIGGRQITSIESSDVVDLARGIEERGALDLARRVWQTCGQVFRYAITLRGPDGKPLMRHNPAKEVNPGDALKRKKRAHYARLDASEMPELLRKIYAYQGTPYTRFALQLIALTFVRTSELIEARWEEFDLKNAKWQIPGERMKMGTPHIVPLSRQALDVLRCLMEIRLVPARLVPPLPEAGDAASPGIEEPTEPKRPSGLLFPGERDHEKPMSNNTILGALKRMGYAGRMTGHGFRGVASTILHEHGFKHAHIELQLAHQERDDVSAAYNFAQHLAERRQMMQWYADHLEELRQSAKVLPFKAA